MKLPFCSVLGRPMRKNLRTVKKLCKFPFLNVSTSYGFLLGMLGSVLSLVDIVRIVRSGPVLPEAFWRTRIQSGKVVTPECERDLKLISLVISFEYYLLIVIGTVSQNPVLFLPWLFLYAFIIVAEFTNFLLRLIIDGLECNRHTIILSMFTVYNWLTIFCSFAGLTGVCDFC